MSALGGAKRRLPIGGLMRLTLTLGDCDAAAQPDASNNIELEWICYASHLKPVVRNGLAGRLFMNSTYVMVNQEAGRFSVWQANPQSKTPEIVAVDKQNNMVDEFCANSMDGSSTTEPLPTSSGTSPPQNQESTLSGGAIGGIAAGAVGGVAIFAIIGFILYRRRTSDVATGVLGEQDMETVDVKLPTYSMAPAGPQELPVDRYDVTELDGRAINGSRV
ncbi:hypothetical protein P3342_011036 [Pyrenophora teres f. teres]|uniref:Uncharacterized protein n=2 Tax=Pyrenophora teres f. teres TaxID=97479 RepID=E3S4R4_PYRTT|nr:hypothetical protein PTT_17582 [Pyrenophora teres f. teres 0-1]KAE8832092.1 hypothetical protein HRS9139_06334 [Pyrenophora teres f. teres]KAE8835175.1 hypothetical protein HRS9122_07445 [Pyrenophora teres f. teres]KAE8858074.1 hypothetical protein PTNB29_07289 [Pyrenophora teres f. teres]KAE8862088.1 hypothetical protein PTNB73_07642 [Pyrenophora teres f. teres]